MRETTLFLAFITSCFLGFAQSLKNDNLDINPGGVVYDVIYDEINDSYIVAGDFTSIQGIPRLNLAIIDASTYTVSGINPISSINGAIRTLALTQTPASFPNDGLSRLFLGGEFTSINGVTRNYLCQMRKIEPLVGPFNTNYTVNNSWDAEIVDVADPSDHVNDFAVRGDTIIAVGQFVILNGTVSYATNDFGGTLGFSRNSDAFNFLDVFNSFSQTNMFSEHFELEFIDGEFILAGEQGFERFDANGNSIASFPICSTGYPFTFEIHKTDTDTLIIGQMDYGGGEGIGVYELDGNMLNCPFNNQISPIFMDGGSLVNGSIESYNDDIFIAEDNQILNYIRNGVTQLQPDLVTTMNPNWYSYVASGYRPRKMKVAKDKLFVFGDNLTTVNGQSHLGLAVMCLPPEDAETFTTSNNSVCEEESATYTIPPVEFVSGYRWEYSGTGAQYRIAGTVNPFQSLNDAHISAINANGIEVYFPSGSTDGTLTVTPYSTCNSTVDYQYGGGQSTNIQIVPLPDVSMSDTLYLNCYSDSGWLVVNSTAPGVSYEIQSSFGTIFNDSLSRDTSITGLIEEYYYGTAIEPLNGCSTVDSTWLEIDFELPVILNSQINLNPNEFNCSTDSLEVNASVPGTSITWEYDPDPTIPLPNPFYIYSDDSLNFTATALKLSNGCTNTLGIAIPTNLTQASGAITGYPTITLPLDTISCSTPTLTLECTAMDGTAAWMQTGTDSITITIADTVGMVNNVQTYSFETTHNVSGCNLTVDATIYFDLAPPFIVPYVGTPTINCSDTSTELVHLSTGVVVEGWLDTFGIQTGSDTLIANSTGEYYYQAVGTNGCIVTDTVQVTQTLDITLNLPEDTLICPLESIYIYANPFINTGEVPYFGWSDGSVGNFGTATGGILTELSVIVTTDSGCIGYDTTAILITEPIDAYFSSSSGCTAATIQVDSIFGGNGGYEYSLDQSNWQSAPAFNGVNTGPIDIYIRDNLGCIYTFHDTVAPAIGGPPLDFLIPTYSNPGDTAVAVSFETSAVFDSLTWEIPLLASMVVDYDSLIAFTIDTEGWYDITLVGHLDTCQYSTTKTIYFGSKPALDSAANNWGVLDISVTPNPTSELFVVSAQLGKNQTYSIFVNSLYGQEIPSMTTTGTGTVVAEYFTFPFGTASGTYVIHFVGQYDARQLLIIKN